MYICHNHFDMKDKGTYDKSTYINNNPLDYFQELKYNILPSFQRRTHRKRQKSTTFDLEVLNVFSCVS